MLRKLLYVVGAVVVVANRKKIVQAAGRATAYLTWLRKSSMARELLMRDIRSPFRRTYTSEEVLEELWKRHAGSTGADVGSQS